MSLAPHARPAARSAAVRPRSTSDLTPSVKSLSRALARSAGSPRPVGSYAPPGAAQPLLFLSFSPRPIGGQQCLVAGRRIRREWEHSCLGNSLGERRKRAFSAAYATVPTVSTPGRARVMRLRVHTRIILSLSLGTWIQSSIVFAIQRLKLFPRLFPAARLVGTWIQPEGEGLACGRLSWSGNKVEAGNADQRLPGGDARQKFRAAIAAAGALGALELLADTRIQLQLTRRGDNGGNLRFSARTAGHVGTMVLEGLGQAPDLAAISAARRELGRLAASAGAQLTRRALELGRGELAGVRAEATPTPPNADRPLPGTLAMAALGIWIEHCPGRAGRPVSSGQFHDGIFWTVSESAQSFDWRRGPGGCAAGQTPEKRQNPRNSMEGGRAGVITSRLVRGSTTPSEWRKLRVGSPAVKRLLGAAA